MLQHPLGQKVTRNHRLETPISLVLLLYQLTQGEALVDSGCRRGRASVEAGKVCDEAPP
jgi:hypothetical protein